jgi:hypothetical protein
MISKWYWQWSGWNNYDQTRTGFGLFGLIVIDSLDIWNGMSWDNDTHPAVEEHARANSVAPWTIWNLGWAQSMICPCACPDQYPWESDGTCFILIVICDAKYTSLVTPERAVVKFFHPSSRSSRINMARVFLYWTPQVDRQFQKEWNISTLQFLRSLMDQQKEPMDSGRFLILLPAGIGGTPILISSQ